MRGLLWVFAASLLFLWQCPAAQASAQTGRPAPALSVRTLGGTPFDLGALRGKVVIVNVWATWCPPCRAEMPALDAFYRRYHSRGVAMIGLSADRARDRDDVQDAMRGFAYPAAMLDNATANGFGAPVSLPVTYVIDAKGVLRFVLTPDKTPITAKSLANAVLPLLPH